MIALPRIEIPRPSSLQLRRRARLEGNVSILLDDNIKNHRDNRGVELSINHHICLAPYADDQKEWGQARSEREIRNRGKGLCVLVEHRVWNLMDGIGA